MGADRNPPPTLLAMGMGQGGPVIDGSRDGLAKTMLLFAGGILATLAVVVGLVTLWPSGDDDANVAVDGDTVTTVDEEIGGTTTTVAGAAGEPSEPTTTAAPVVADPPPSDLFVAGAPRVLADLAAAGGPTQAIQILVYPDYAFLAYRDPVDPANIDRRMWRAGAVDEAAPNPIDDRVDADTEPSLFALSEIDLNVLPTLTADAPARFELPVGVTHVIIDRFLPFDERVLFRVYASPSDGRSGGGYVQYGLDGSFVKVVQ